MSIPIPPQQQEKDITNSANLQIKMKELHNELNIFIQSILKYNSLVKKEIDNLSRLDSEWFSSTKLLFASRDKEITDIIQNLKNYDTKVIKDQSDNIKKFYNYELPKSTSTPLPTEKPFGIQVFENYLKSSSNTHFIEMIKSYIYYFELIKISYDDTQNMILLFIIKYDTDIKKFPSNIKRFIYQLIINLLQKFDSLLIYLKDECKFNFYDCNFKISKKNESKGFFTKWYHGKDLTIMEQIESIKQSINIINEHLKKDTGKITDIWKNIKEKHIFYVFTPSLLNDIYTQVSRVVDGNKRITKRSLILNEIFNNTKKISNVEKLLNDFANDLSKKEEIFKDFENIINQERDTTIKYKYSLIFTFIAYILNLKIIKEEDLKTASNMIKLISKNMNSKPLNDKIEEIFKDLTKSEDIEKIYEELSNVVVIKSKDGIKKRSKKRSIKKKSPKKK